MENFRKDIDAQHASQALIEMTINQIQREAELEETAGFGRRQNGYGNRLFRKGKKPVFVGFGIIIVCAMIAVGVIIQPSRLIYNEMNISVERGNRSQKDFTEITLKEYEQYLNRSLSEHLADFTIEKVYITVRYDEDGEQIQEDLAAFYLRVDGETVILRVSGNQSPAPKELLSGKASAVGKIDVYMGITDGMNQLEAAFVKENVNYYLLCRDMKKGDFESMLKKLIKKL